MSLSKFFESNYQTACVMQREITKDDQMKAMINSRAADSQLIHSWMRDYGLFETSATNSKNLVAESIY